MSNPSTNNVSFIFPRSVHNILISECSLGAENFRDIEFKQRMHIAGLYYQSLSLPDKWELLINLEDDYIHDVIGKAMAGDKNVDFETVGSILTTAIYARIEDTLQDLFIDAYQDYKAARREELHLWNRSAYAIDRDGEYLFNIK